jgi:hypothetical protein
MRVCINVEGKFINIYRDEIYLVKGGWEEVEKKNESDVLRFAHVFCQSCVVCIITQTRINM